MGLFSSTPVFACVDGEGIDCPASENSNEVNGEPVIQSDTTIILREPLPGQGDTVTVSAQKGSIAILAEWVGHIYRFIAALSVIIAILIFMFAGFQMMFSGGDSGAKETAKDMIQKVLMGLALLFLSGLILNFVNPKFYVFGGPSVTKEQVQSGDAPNTQPNTNATDSNTSSSALSPGNQTLGTNPVNTNGNSLSPEEAKAASDFLNN